MSTPYKYLKPFRTLSNISWIHGASKEKLIRHRNKERTQRARDKFTSATTDKRKGKLFQTRHRCSDAFLWPACMTLEVPWLRGVTNRTKCLVTEAHCQIRKEWKPAVISTAGNTNDQWDYSLKGNRKCVERRLLWEAEKCGLSWSLEWSQGTCKNKERWEKKREKGRKASKKPNEP